MHKTKNKIILAAVAAVVLAVAWLSGGTLSTPASAPVAATPPAVAATDLASGTTPVSATEPASVTESAPAATPSAVAATDPAPVATPVAATEPAPVTEPTPATNPAPATESTSATESAAAGVLTCTLSVRCDNLLGNLDALSPDKRELVPPDGIIFPATVVTFSEGESVFDVLQREMQKSRIHLEFMSVPLYGSVYIEGMNNLYEFDGGPLSGWMYKVNDWFPNYGCSLYYPENGDVIEWLYTCDLGNDVGGGYAAGNDS